MTTEEAVKIEMLKLDEQIKTPVRKIYFIRVRT